MKSKHATSPEYSRSDWEPTIDELMTNPRKSQGPKPAFGSADMFVDTVTLDRGTATVELLPPEILFPGGNDTDQ
jgi:hypothetical protein